jgi:hypothetical protein
MKMKKVLRKLLNKLNYDIVKIKSVGTEKHKVSSDVVGMNLYNTPIGKYYLPAALKNDVVANVMKSGRYFDFDIIELAKVYAKPGQSMLDVGANYGQMSIEFSKIAGGYMLLKQNLLLRKF